MSILRVAILSYTPSLGGSSVVASHHAEFLAGCCSVALIDANPELISAEVSKGLAAEIKHYRVPIWGGYLEANRGISTALDDFRPEVILINNPALLIRNACILRLAQAKGVKVVAMIHSGALTLTFRRRIMEILTSLLLIWADDVVFVSNYTLRYWVRKYWWLRYARSRVVHNGVEIPDHVPVGESSGRFSVGFVGRVTSEKGPELFCQTAELGRAEGVDAEFVMVGDGRDKAVLEKKYGHCVRFTGHLPAEHWKSQIDLLVMTSPIENCSMAVLEAKAVGIPSVVLSTGGNPEIVCDGVDGVHIASPATPSALIAGIRRVMSSYPILQAGCLSERSRFSRDTSCRKVWDKYRKRRHV